MLTNTHTIEDCLEVACGLTTSPAIKLQQDDTHIISSLARQVFKGTGLTDKQLDLSVEKLKTYADQLFELGYDLNQAQSNLRIPLRKIDRSKWIKLLQKEDLLYIGIRFTFNKKYLKYIEPLNQKIKNKHYDRARKTHYFPYSERNLFDVMSCFEKSNFEVEEQLLTVYKEILNMSENSKDYVPGVYGFSLKNLNDNAIDYMISSVGQPSAKTLHIYKDRDHLFGLDHFDSDDLEEALNNLLPLTRKVISRETNQILIDSKEYNFEEVASTLVELQRFPLLIILPKEDPLYHLEYAHECFSKVISDESMSVLFRLENKGEGLDFNQYIKDNNLNKPLDNTTKIVYISNNKLPKTLFKVDWQPVATLQLDSERLGTYISTYVDAHDLVIHYDTDVTPFNRKVQKI